MHILNANEIALKHWVKLETFDLVLWNDFSDFRTETEKKIRKHDISAQPQT